jgi:hypothetical protein
LEADAGALEVLLDVGPHAEASGRMDHQGRTMGPPGEVHLVQHGANILEIASQPRDDRVCVWDPRGKNPGRRPDNLRRDSALLVFVEG